LAAPALDVAGDPVLLEPADVAERPEHRVELRRERCGKIGGERERRAVGGRLERARPAQGVVARVDQGERKQLLAGRAQAGAVEAGRVELDHGGAEAAAPARQLNGRKRAGTSVLLRPFTIILFGGSALPHTHETGTMRASSITAVRRLRTFT